MRNDDTDADLDSLDDGLEDDLYDGAIADQESESDDEDDSSGVSEDTSEEPEPEIDDGEVPASIPVNRFNRVIDERNYQQKENERLRQELAEARAASKQNNEDTSTPPPFDIKQARRAYFQAQEDDDVEKALELSEQIDEYNNAQIIRQMQETMGNQGLSQTQITQLNMERISSDALREFPELNPHIPATYDKAKVDDINGWTDIFNARGDDRATALAKAVGKVMGTKAPEQTPSDKPDITGMRNSDAQNRRARGQQAPKRNGSGLGATDTDTLPDIDGMSDEEFDRLPDEELDKLLYSPRRSR